MRGLIFILSIITGSVFAQTATSSAGKGISIGASFSPDHCFRILKTNQQNQFIVDSRDSFEIPRFGFTSGLAVLYDINGNSLEIGVLFSDKGEKTKPYNLTYAQPDPSAPVRAVFSYSYRCIDIPLKYNYDIIGKRFNFFISAGGATSIFISNRITALKEFSDGSSAKTHDTDNITKYNSLFFSVLIGAGIELNLNPNVQLRSEILYRRGISPVADSSVKEYLYSTGLNTGIFVKF